MTTANVATKPAPLTEAESLALTDLEGIIERGFQTFVDVGAAVDRIRERRLYRGTHDTFEAYCQERWGWSRQRAAQLIGAHEVVASLSTMVDTDDLNEREARALADVPTEQRATVLTEAREEAKAEGKKVTAERIRDTAHKYVPISERKPSKPKPETPEEAARRAVEAAEKRKAGETQPPSRVAAPRLPAVPRIRDMIRACTDVEDVTDAELRRLPMNDITLGHLARAHEIIGRILNIHGRKCA